MSEKYNYKLEICKNNIIECMKEYDKETFVKNMYNYRKLIKELILDVINEFEELKKNRMLCFNKWKFVKRH